MASPAAILEPQTWNRLKVFGQALKKLGPKAKGFLFDKMNRGKIVGRLASDAFFGGLAAVTTPGDLGDKAIAGGTQFVGGGFGVLVAGGAARKLGAGAGLQTAADFAGSFGGDFAGMAVGDNLQRGKDKLMGGKGMTAWERMSAEQQEEFRRMEQEVLEKYGLLPGNRSQFFQ